MKTKSIILTVLISMLTTSGMLYFYWSLFEKKAIQSIPETYNAKFASLVAGSQSDNPDFVLAASKSVQSVVHVKTQYNQQVTGTVYDFFFGYQTYQQPVPVSASGSGVIISDDGYIVTNNHVVKDAEYIEVVLDDQRSFPAKIIGTDPTTDIALLKIEETGLPFIQYGNSDDVKVGEWVLAVGNPFNLTSTVTAGIVSAKTRNINILSGDYAIESFIQTDAAVNPGNSGGALVNTKGELVGINTAIASNTGTFTGYSFAIPVNIVKKIVADLLEFGEAQRAYLGVKTANIDSKLAQQIGIDKIEGVYVANVFQDGAAAEAGLQNGDIITKVEDFPVNNVSALLEQIGKYRPGDKVNLSVKRDDNLKQITVTLRNKHGNTKIVKTETLNLLGANIQELTNDEKLKLKLKNGVKVTDLGAGKLRAAGVKDGFIITSINRKQIFSLDDIEQMLKNYRGGIYVEGVYPNGMVAYYAFGI